MTYTYAVRALSLARRSMLLLFLFGCVAPLHAQQRLVVAVERENLRAEPRGEILAELEQGTPLQQVSEDGPWREVVLRGWIWAASLGSAGTDERVAVTADGGENLRASANGTLLGRLRPGMVLTELERDGAWVLVERTAWMWGESVAPSGEATTEVARAGVPTVEGAEVGDGDSTAAAAPSDSALAANWLRAGPGGAVLLSAPDGDTIAQAGPLTAMEVIAREGSWARVRVEGWVWEPGSSSAADSGAVLRNISAATIASAPESFRGRIVEWNVQFIALERAEKIRTDFYEGEPFMLARAPGDEASFVYIAVPPERVAQVEELTPLERVTVLGRIRTGRSHLMGAPVLDLLELRREQ